MVDVDAGVFAYLVFSPTCHEHITFLCHIHGLMQDSIHVRPAVICYGGVGNVVHCVISFTDWSGGCLDKTPVLDALPMSR